MDPSGLDPLSFRADRRETPDLERVSNLMSSWTLGANWRKPTRGECAESRKKGPSWNQTQNLLPSASCNTLKYSLLCYESSQT